MDRKRRLCEFSDGGAEEPEGPSEAKQGRRHDDPPIHSMTLQNPWRNVFLNLNKLRLDNRLCEWLIRSNDNEEMAAHSVVLTRSSPYFDKLHSTLSKADIKPLITTFDFPANIIKQILDFSYTSKCTLHKDNVIEVLKAVTKYLFPGVVHECHDYIMLHQIQPENCIALYQSTKAYFPEVLSENIAKYIRHHFHQVLLKNREVLDLTFEEMVMMLRSEDLNVAEEESLFTFIVRWIDEDTQDREPNFLSLFKCLRLGLIDKSFMDNTVMTSRYVCGNPSVQKYLREIEEISTDMNHLTNEQRISSDVLLVIGGWTDSMETNRSYIEVYDKCANQWFPMRNIDAPNDQYYYFNGVCVLFNIVYTIGGYCNPPIWSTTSKVMCFDPVTQVWQQKACMHDARSSLCVVTLDGYIYAIGGCDEFSAIKSVERYDPKGNQWTRIASTNECRRMAGAAVFQGKIYLAGGYSVNYILSSVEVYSPTTDQWSFIRPMLSPRYGLGLVAYQNAIYAIGGDNGETHPASSSLQTVERYEPTKDPRWSYVPSMMTPRRNFAVVVFDDRICALGGSAQSPVLKPVDSTECFGEGCDSWTRMEERMSEERWGHAAVVLSGLTNAKDYSYQEFCAREEREEYRTLTQLM